MPRKRRKKHAPKKKRMRTFTGILLIMLVILVIYLIFLIMSAPSSQGPVAIISIK